MTTHYTQLFLDTLNTQKRMKSLFDASHTTEEDALPQTHFELIKPKVVRKPVTDKHAPDKRATQAFATQNG